MNATSISQPEGQLSSAERAHISRCIRDAARKPEICIEIGTWLGGGSTLHILNALHENTTGHLWGVEADRSIYDRMTANLRAAFPDGMNRFTPLFGLSQQVLPDWLRSLDANATVDFAFLDGGDNPAEQILEFKLLDPRIPVGGQLMSHDAHMRKGKWLVPYLQRLDNWQTQLLDGSEVGLLHARKLKPEPSPQSLRHAEQHLRRQRLHPVELAAVLLPASARSRLAALLPGCVTWYTARQRRSTPSNPA